MSGSFSQFLSFFPDLILILISGTACFYCYLLNRRLTKLNNLETGLGATIVTLTKAIEETYSAAQSSQASTVAAVEKLNALLEKSDVLMPKAELLVKALDRSTQRARDRQELLEYSIDVSLDQAVDKAETTAANLLKIVSQIKDLDINRRAQRSRPAAPKPANASSEPLKKTSAS